MNISEKIDALKARFDVKTDGELAKKLTVDPRTVAAWRARSSMPPRYEAMIDGSLGKGSYLAAPRMWTEHEQAAHRIAHFRLSRAIAPFVADLNVRTSLRLFRKVAASFWLLMLRAQQDIVKVMDDDLVELGNAEAAVIFDDISNSETALDRDQTLLGVQEILQTIVSEKAPPA